MSGRRLTRWLGAAALLCAAGSRAGVIVLHDAGGTEPLAPLLEASGLAGGSVPPAEEAAPELSRERIQFLRARVRSPGLTPGVQPRVATGEAGAMLPRPVFLVGADDYSLRWLARFRDRLEAVGAAGLVVQSDGPSDLRRIRDAAGGLPLALGSGSSLAERFGLKHYPVLIGPEWIEQ